MSFTPPRYSSQPTDFFKTLKARTDEYFTQNRKSRQGDGRMYFKTAFMLAAYLTPWFFVVFVDIQNPILYSILWVAMGISMAGIGLSIMHDAIHGSYSKNKTVNLILGEVINLVGGASINWKIQHNVLHHTYTNVDGYDEDIEAPVFLRFSPNAKWIPAHKYQYIYAWFFYGLLTLNWSTVADFSSLIRYKKKGLLETVGTSFGKELFKLIVFRASYFGYVLVMPLVFSSASVLTVVLGFLLMHFVCGLILSAIFQPAHVMECSEYYDATATKRIEGDWASQQVLNTVNFAPKNKLFTWYVGCLNYQVEHHLFPNICHIHYPALSEIVKTTAKEFNLPYFVEPSFTSAIWNHTKMLKHLGKA